MMVGLGGIMRVLAALVTALVLAVAISGCGKGPAQDPHGPASLAGQTIQLIVPFAPGGGYDAYARQLAPALSDELGATVVVINKPGAGGILATNDVWNTEPDGNTVALFNTPGLLGAALAGSDGVRYDSEKFSYIGRLSSEPDVVITAKDSAYKSWADVMAKKGSPPVRFAATGPGAAEYIDGVVLQRLLNLDSSVVTGYASSSEAYLGVLSKLVDLHSRTYGSQLSGMSSGDAVPLLTIGSKDGLPLLKDTPTLLDVVEPDKRALVESHTKLVESGRIIAGPPGMKPEMLELLRNAFKNVVTDPDYAAAAAKSKRPITFASGQQVADMVADIMRSPKEYVELVKQAYGTANQS
jgi:tripartite-type tricarboxylate transporter receptor subunit TctC